MIRRLGFIPRVNLHASPYTSKTNVAAVEEIDGQLELADIVGGRLGQPAAVHLDLDILKYQLGQSQCGVALGRQLDELVLRALGRKTDVARLLPSDGGLVARATGEYDIAAAVADAGRRVAGRGQDIDRECPSLNGVAVLEQPVELTTVGGKVGRDVERYTERFAEADIEPSVGSVGNSYDCDDRAVLLRVT